MCFTATIKTEGYRTTDNNDCTPLGYAVLLGNFEIAEFLIEKGAQIVEVPQGVTTPLELALRSSHLEFVDLFVERHHVDIKKANHQGWTCLMHAVEFKPLCEYLVDRGVSINDENNEKKQLRIMPLKMGLDFPLDISLNWVLISQRNQSMVTTY